MPNSTIDKHILYINKYLEEGSPKLEEALKNYFIDLAPKSKQELLFYLENEKNQNLYHEIALWGHHQLFDILQTIPLDIQKIDCEGYSPMMRSVESGATEVFKRLWVFDQQEHATRDKSNIYHLAVIGGCPEILSTILSSQRHSTLKLFQPDIFGFLPIDLAMKLNRTDLIQMIYKAGSIWSFTLNELPPPPLNSPNIPAVKKAKRPRLSFENGSGKPLQQKKTKKSQKSQKIQRSAPAVKPLLYTEQKTGSSPYFISSSEDDEFHLLTRFKKQPLNFKKSLPLIKSLEIYPTIKPKAQKSEKKNSLSLNSPTDMSRIFK